MESRVKIAGHPVHPMLVVFPLGLLATAAIFDVISIARDAGRWSEMAFWMIAAGIVGGLAAAVFGLVDFLSIPARTRARSIGILHGSGNVVVVALFAGSWWLRRADPAAPSMLAYGLSFAGVGLALVTGWLGGELVERLGVGIDEGAHLDAPSSLGHRPATDSAHRGRGVAVGR